MSEELALDASLALEKQAWLAMAIGALESYSGVESDISLLDWIALLVATTTYIYVSAYNELSQAHGGVGDGFRAVRPPSSALTDGRPRGPAKGSSRSVGLKDHRAFHAAPVSDH